MEIRHALVGVNIIAVAGITMVYAFVSGMQSLLGVSSSLFVLGFVILAYSLAYSEPLTNLLYDYSEMLTRFTVKVLEDMNLLDVKPILLNRNGRFILVYTHGQLHGDVVPGVGIVEGVPYVALDLAPLVKPLGGASGMAAGNPETSIASMLSDVFAVAGLVGVELRGNVFEIVVERVHSVIKSMVGFPVNPLIIASLVAVSTVTAKSAKLRSIVCTGSICRLTVEVL